MKTTHLLSVWLSCARLAPCLGSLACAVVLAHGAAAAPMLETLVFTAGGYSSYPTYSREPHVAVYFNDGLSMPSIGLAAAGVPGEIRSQTAATGPLTDMSSLSVGFSGNSFVGSTRVRADYGTLGAEAHGTYTGFQSSNVVAGAQGMARFTETFTITSPTIADGTAGLVNFLMTIDGSTVSSAGAPGNGSSGRVIVNYQKDSGPIYTMMRATADPRGGPDLYPYSTTTGWTKTGGNPTSVVGASTFSTIFDVPFVYGTPFDFTFAMLAYAVPGVGSSDVDFYHSAVLTGITTIAPDALITGASGTAYNHNGVVTPALPGDTDSDGDIDDTDLGTMFANYTGPVGASGTKTSAHGDTDGDGDVDDSDLGSAFSGYTGPLSPTTVPEPATLALLAMGAALGLSRRPRSAASNAV